MDLGHEADALAAELRDLSPEPVDPAPIIRTQLPFYGVSVKDLRRLAAGWHRAHPDADPTEVGALADELWSRAIREEMVVAALLLGRNRSTREVWSPARLEQWAPLLDNWETTDQLGMTVIGPWIGDDPEQRIGALGALAGDEHPWTRRLALVAAARLSRLDDAERWWPAASGIVLRLGADTEAAIPKAISWVLREHTRRSADEVARFIDDHDAVLPAVAKREARRKLATGRK